MASFLYRISTRYRLVALPLVGPTVRCPRPVWVRGPEADGVGPALEMFHEVRFQLMGGSLWIEDETNIVVKFLEAKNV